MTHWLLDISLITVTIQQQLLKSRMNVANFLQGLLDDQDKCKADPEQNKQSVKFRTYIRRIIKISCAILVEWDTPVCIGLCIFFMNILKKSHNFFFNSFKVILLIDSKSIPIFLSVLVEWDTPVFLFVCFLFIGGEFNGISFFLFFLNN